MKIMFIGPVSAGKTTLIQRLCEKEIREDKTQAVEYVNEYIDTPGEYMQVRAFWCSLTITSHDADLICLVQDATSEDCWFSGGIGTKFSKPVAGIVTKIDSPKRDERQARSYLEYAGCHRVFCVSALTNEGMGALEEGMREMVLSYRAKERERQAANYFD